MLKKLLSYIIPIKISEQPSNFSEKLEISYNFGKKVLDSANTNYSYGNLQKILRKGLVAVGFKKISKMDYILVLGVAAGSVIETLVNEIKFSGKITGVEIDTEIIDVANNFFCLQQFQNFELIIGDASDFVLKTKRNFDLIIIDVFLDIEMPSFLFEKFFISRLDKILNNQGYIIYNTIVLNKKQQQRNDDYLIFANSIKGWFAKNIKCFGDHNELFIVSKKTIL